MKFPNWKNPRFLFAGLVIFEILFLPSLCRKFPPVNNDEASTACISSNLFHGRGYRYSLNDDVFAPEMQKYSHLSNTLGRPILISWAGLWGRLVPSGFWFFRLSSVFLGVLSLFIFFQIGKILRDEKLGLILALLLAIQPLFILGSCVVEGSILLFTAGSLLILFSLTKMAGEKWGIFSLGFLSALTVMIHPNGLIFSIGLGSFSSSSGALSNSSKL